MLKKIQRLAELVHPLISEMEPEVEHQVLHTICLLTWCYYNTSDTVPDYDYVKGIGSKYHFFGDEKSQTDEEKKWNAYLQEYQFTSMDELDLALAKIVERGYVVEEEFGAPAKGKNDLVIAMKGQQSFQDIWDLYHNSFDDNADEIIAGLSSGIKAYGKYVTPINLDGSVRVLRGLGRDDLAEKAIDDYIEIRAGEPEVFHLEAYPFPEHVADATIKEKFAEAHARTRKVRTLKEVVRGIAGKDSWGSKDEEVLANATVDEFVELFKAEKGKHLTDYVNACLQFGRFTNATERQKKIAENAALSLEQIGKENSLNKMRVRKFGLKIPDETTKP